MKRVLLILSAMLTLSVSARTIDVSQHGILPDADMTFQLNKLLKSLSSEENITLSFPRATYHFYPENATDRYHAVTNHDNSLRKIIFDLKGFNKLTIEGNGSLFMFYGMATPFIVSQSNEVHFQNFSVDFDTPFNQELKVVEVNEADNSFIVEVLEMDYPFKIEKGRFYFGNYGRYDLLAQNLPYDPTTGTLHFNPNRYAIWGHAQYQQIGPNRVLIKKGCRELPPVGTIYCNITDRPNRLSETFHFIESNDIVIHDVNIHAGGGMGVIAERCDNVELTRLRITPSGNRTFSVRADATHFNGCKGLVKVTDCLFENMGDDAINVHGSYVDIVEYMGNNTFLCQLSHPQQWGFIFCGKGDELMITSRRDLSQLHKVTVTDTERINERRFLVTVDQVPTNYPEGPLSLENLTWYPDVVMRNCRVQNNRARSALISTKGKVLLENNYFSSEMHGVLIEGDNKAWYESGSVCDVTIRRNIFDNGGFGSSQSYYPLLASPMLNPDQTLGSTPYHRNIHFVDNHIIGYSPRLVSARSVQGLVIKNNLIEQGTRYPSDSSTLAITLDFCTNVVISNNKWRGFSAPVTLEQAANMPPVKPTKNSGSGF